MSGPQNLRDAQRGLQKRKRQIHARNRLIRKLQRIVEAARPFMRAIPSWDGNPNDPVHVIVDVQQCVELCCAFDDYDGKAKAELEKAIQEIDVQPE